ncbi:MAG: hypothetical protein WC833_11025 [Bacteroidales bacterium]|jgi:hypothetical protein
MANQSNVLNTYVLTGDSLSHSKNAHSIAIPNNPNATYIVVNHENKANASDWLTAIGTLGAVMISLFLSYGNRRKKLVRIRSFYIYSPRESSTLTLSAEIENNSDYPLEIKQISFRQNRRSSYFLKIQFKPDRESNTIGPKGIKDLTLYGLQLTYSFDTGFKEIPCTSMIDLAVFFDRNLKFSDKEKLDCKLLKRKLSQIVICIGTNIGTADIHNRKLYHNELEAISRNFVECFKSMKEDK